MQRNQQQRKNFPLKSIQRCFRFWGKNFRHSLSKSLCCTETSATAKTNFQQLRKFTKIYAISTTLPFVFYNYNYGQRLTVNNDIKICQRYERQYLELCLVSKSFVYPLPTLALPFPQKVGFSVLFLLLTIKWWEAWGSLGSISACQDQQQSISMFLGEHIFAELWNHLTDKLNFTLLCDVEFFTEIRRSETSC